MPKITLKDAPKATTYDQDKTLSPEETVRRFHERVESLDIRIFREIQRIDNGRLDIPVYFALYGEDGARLTGLRKQMGKGGTVVQAEASAVMELTERFSLYAYRSDPENFTTATQAQLGKKALSPQEIAASVHDDTPYRDTALAFFSRFPMRWCKATDFADGNETLVPFDWFFLINEFNGTSAGNVLSEALVQGVSEVIERHVSAAVCQDFLAPPRIRPESVTDPVTRELLEKFDRAGIRLVLSDLSLDTGIPTVSVLAWDPDTLGALSEIVWTAGTAPCPQKALSRALTEAAQLAGDFNTGANYVASGLPKPQRLEEADFFRNVKKFVPISDLPDLSDNNMRVEAERLVAASLSAGFPVYSINTTYAGLGIPTLYTLLPGARFRERAASGSVAMFLARLITETQATGPALALLMDMDEEMPGTHCLPFYIGTTLLEQGNPEGALRRFSEALKKDPGDEDRDSILVYRGVALKDLEQYGEALETLSRVVARDPDRTEAHNLMGFCLFKLKRHREAIESFEKIVALNPGSAIDYANIASNYRELGEREKAIEYYERALSLDPGIDFARDNLEKLKAD